jgi:hypothetical protein
MKKEKTMKKFEEKTKKQGTSKPEASNEKVSGDMASGWEELVELDDVQLTTVVGGYWGDQNNNGKLDKYEGGNGNYFGDYNGNGKLDKYEGGNGNYFGDYNGNGKLDKYE